MDITTDKLLELYGHRKAKPKTFFQLWDEATSGDEKYNVRRMMLKLHREEIRQNESASA